MRKLVLFDIDGTILHTAGAGRRAMEASLLRHFGTTGPAGYRYDGKTDMQIVRELMRESGFSDADIDARIPEVLTAYLQALEGELQARPERVYRYPGVMELLDALDAHERHVLGLLTGNVVDGAHRKLSAVGVAPARFRVGAFGSDHEHRHELPSIALRRALDLVGHAFPGHDVVIIGDTPADVACGRGIGARAIAVATGHYSVDELRTHNPAAVFADLSDTQAVLHAIAHA